MRQEWKSQESVEVRVQLGGIVIVALHTDP